MMVAIAAKPVRIGPSGLPERTLGWAAIEWACTYLLQPDGPRGGEPWEFTEEQMSFLAWYYAIDERGQFIHTYAVLRRMKGWGKDPLGAVLCAIEMVGPCRFGGWGRDGEPIAVPQKAAWVQTAAVAKEQTRNTMVLFPSLFSKRAIEDYSIDMGKEIIYAHHGQAQIQAVTSSPKTLEGARSTFVLMNETQHWLDNNDGTEMAKAVRRNSAKVGGRPLAITNAHRIGEGSVAEEDWEKWLAEGEASSMLYDSVEAPEETDIDDDESLRAGLEAARGDSYWVPIDRLMIDMRDQRDTESYRRRYYLNQIRSERAGWISTAEWEATAREEAVPEGALIVLGFDGSRFRDATALVGTVVETGYQWVLGVWERPNGVNDWEVPPDEVKALVGEAFARYDVFRMYCDPYWWEETIAKFAGEYGDERVVFFHTNARIGAFARAVKAYETAVRAGELGHERSDVFARHISNCVKREVGIKDEDQEPLYVIDKENKNSTHKIDVADAAILSWEARTHAIAEGARPRAGWIIV